MYRNRFFFASTFLAAAIALTPHTACAQSPTATAAQQSEGLDDTKTDKDRVIPSAELTRPVLWHQQEIATLDLFHGQGGEKHMPVAPFKFVEETKSGTNPKFDLTDAEDHKWRVKVGEEPKPEVVASRLLWAMGYYANDDYLVPAAQVADLKLHRKSDHIRGDTITDARFQRRPGGQKKIGIWAWDKNPFHGTREENGLLALMAVINNWDLKDVNNAVYADDKTGRQILLCSDIGASFGTNGLSRSRSESKGNIESFEKSRFIEKKRTDTVDFATPASPKALLAIGALVPFFERRKLDHLGKKIPIADARWMGTQLGMLSHQQLVDAFRAGTYSQADTDRFLKVVESRIAALKAL